MRKSRYSEEQIIGILREHEAGANATDLSRRHGSKHDPRIHITTGIPLDLPTRSLDGRPMPQPASSIVTRSC